MIKNNKGSNTIYSVGCLQIKASGIKSNTLTYDWPSKKSKWLGSLEHQEVVRLAREKGELTIWESATKDILDNFEMYFDYACKHKQPAILVSIHYVCIGGFMDSFLFEGKSMLYAAQYNQADELIKKCLQTIEKEISAYQKVINSVIANEFLEELFTFREHMGNLLRKSKEVELTAYTLQENTNIESNDVSVQKTPKSKSISYVWQGKPEEIDTLYSQLIKDGYLPASTDAENFKALFTGKTLSSIEPLQWLKNKNLLAYLIDELYDIGKMPSDTNYWSIAEACFTDIKNLKQIKINYLNNKNQSKPKGFEKIDTILREVK
ncbi:hypothetical protein I2I11_00395 [Pontibacter sp. 172403-2]|uniref:hypothetical protein n=1 Tax=Pontibacter rufus TaxID=2791028 RepID=UPI0018AFA835|nr:hypothetical protein [Pontibacter sp. 172403-2]MBF9251741.1 hypothetical protein [Pontibacter sp. 172403-2]